MAGTLYSNEFLAVEFPAPTVIRLDDTLDTVSLPANTPYTTNQSSITFTGTAWVMESGRKGAMSSDMAQCFSIDRVVTFS